MEKSFNEKVKELFRQHEELVSRKNIPVEGGNGIFTRYQYPILTAAHAPIFWRYDLDEKTNPYLMERIGVNATLNSGAIKWNGKYLLVVRVEGADRKSFFAVAESPNGVDNFRFWDYPITMPDDVVPATNIYDMRLTAHEDGWIYGGTFLERNRYSQSVQDSGIRANYSATTEISGTWEVLMGDLYLTYNLNSLEVKVGDVDLQVNDWDYEMQMFMDEYKGDFRREIYSETYRESRRNYKEANDYEGAFEDLEIEGNRLSFLSGDAGRVTLRKLKE